jgi:hypothetical protein
MVRSELVIVVLKQHEPHAAFTNVAACAEIKIIAANAESDADLVSSFKK